MDPIDHLPGNRQRLLYGGSCSCCAGSFQDDESLCHGGGARIDDVQRYRWRHLRHQAGDVDRHRQFAGEQDCDSGFGFRGQIFQDGNQFAGVESGGGGNDVTGFDAVVDLFGGDVDPITQRFALPCQPDGQDVDRVLLDQFLRQVGSRFGDDGNMVHCAPPLDPGTASFHWMNKYLSPVYHRSGRRLTGSLTLRLYRGSGLLSMHG